MSIDIKFEKESALSTQDTYDIINFATEAAYDNGFMNSFIFQRALYLFAAIILLEDEKDEIRSLVAENINTAWDVCLEKGYIDKLTKYEKELDYLAENGRTWFDEYTTYAHSARGLLDTLQMFTGDIVSNAAKQFQNVNDGSAIQQVLEIADEWGMNRKDISVEDSVLE